MPRTFLVSDDSINSYGFRVLTSGINITNFKNNPVMLFNHESYSWGADVYNGPIGRWENLVKDTEGLKADAIFDVNDPKGKIINDKVENNFIRAASIGFRVIKTSSDPADLLPGQTRPTITECELIEISVVDLPANQNALALYDRDNKKIDLNNEEALNRIALGGLSKKTENHNPMKLKLVKVLTSLSAFFKWNHEEGKELEVEITNEQLQSLDAELSRLNEANTQLHAAVEGKQTELNTLTGKVADLEKQVSTLQSELLNKNATGRTVAVENEDDGDQSDFIPSSDEQLNAEIKARKEIAEFQFTNSSKIN